MSVLETIMGWVSGIFTSILGMIGNLLNLIYEQPVLGLFCVALPLCGIAVGMLRRVLRTRG